MQRLELTWIGKNQEPRLEPRILLENPEHRTGTPSPSSPPSHLGEGPGVGLPGETWQGMLIHGDNLLALKALEQDYAGKVKCIYIDPPYNTGSAFEHYDDGIEHSLWLSLIRDRLKILKNLLREDGSIWISIDDNECHYLKVLCDEVFGRGNFVASIIWEKRKTRENRRAFSFNHDYLLIFGKDKKKFEATRNPIGLTQEVLERYKNPDNDPRGPWQSISANAQAGHATASQFYKLKLPSGREIDPPKGNCWRYTKHRMEEEVAKSNIWFGVNGDNAPRIKKFLNESEDKGLTPETVWKAEEVGTNDDAKKHQLSLVEGEVLVFDNPKPEALIERVIHIATSPGDLVLDSFLGSGTTAAVAHKMGRRWIGIELGEHAHTHCLPRLRKVVRGEDPGGISKAVGWPGGGGFRYYTLAPSLLRQDPYGQWVISPDYDAQMLAAAVAKHEGFRYDPDPALWWKQSRSSERDWLLVTTQYVNRPLLDSIREGMAEGDTLLVCCKAFDKNCATLHPAISVKKIPNLLVHRCEYGRDDYSLHIVNVPLDAPEADEWLPLPTEPAAEVGRKIAKQTPDNQQSKLF